MSRAWLDGPEAGVPDLVKLEDARPQGSGARRFIGLPRGVALGACLLLVGLAHANSLSSGFVYDDRYAIVENRDIRAVRNVPRFFSGHYWAGSGNPAGANYRPVALFSFALDYAVWELRPLGFRITNLLMQLAAVALAFLVAQRLTGSIPAAMFAAAVFGVHPVQTEVVNCASNRGDILVAIFVLAALSCHMRVLPGDAPGSGSGSLRWIPALGAWACFALACLAKETGIAAVAVFLGYDWLYRSDARPRRLLTLLRRQLAPVYAGFALVAVAYLGLRTAAIGSPFGRQIGFVENPLAFEAALRQKLLAIAIAGWQGRLLLWPRHLSVDHSYRSLPIDLHWASADALLGAIVIACCAALLLWGWRRNRAIAFAVVFLASTYSVTSNFFFPNDVMMADRFLSLPLFGFALIVAELFRSASMGLSRRGIALSVAVAVAIVAGYLGRSVVRNLDWRDDLRLMEAADRSAPGSAKTQAALGQAFAAKGQLERSAEAYQRALAIWPGYTPVLSDLALILSQLDRHGEALRAARLAVDRLPRDPLGWNNLGFAYYHAGRLSEAASAWRTALPIRPDFAAARNNLREVEEELASGR
jgi:tetratricopeptide (TPR) repeat protein